MIEVGSYFNSLFVESGPYKNKKNSYYICLCACGNKTTAKPIQPINKTKKSCGCYRKKYMSLKMKTHGLSNTKEFTAWSSMKDRCYLKTTKSYKNYGGRGITVCDRWINSFENFFQDLGMAPTGKHSLDRINVNGNYEPENCRWATWSEQAKNKRPRGKSGFKGVSVAGKKFRVTYFYGDKRVHVGIFKNVEEAIEAYNLATKNLF